MTLRDKDLSGFLSQPLSYVLSYQYAQPDWSVYFIKVSCIREGKRNQKLCFIRENF